MYVLFFCILNKILKKKKKRLCAKNILDFYQAVLPEKKPFFFRKYSQKNWVLGYLPVSIYPFQSEL